MCYFVPDDPVEADVLRLLMKLRRLVVLKPVSVVVEDRLVWEDEWGVESFAGQWRRDHGKITFADELVLKQWREQIRDDVPEQPSEEQVKALLMALDWWVEFAEGGSHKHLMWTDQLDDDTCDERVRQLLDAADSGCAPEKFCS